MPPTNLGQLEMVECTDLPAQTIVAPLSIIREIRAVLGQLTFNLLVGTEEYVRVSSDLFEAYSQWDAARSDIDPLCN